MKIQKGKSYLAIIDHKLTEIRVDEITQASNFKVEVEGAKRFLWFSFWQIYAMVEEELKPSTIKSNK